MNYGICTGIYGKNNQLFLCELFAVFHIVIASRNETFIEKLCKTYTFSHLTNGIQIKCENSLPLPLPPPPPRKWPKNFQVDTKF